MVKVLVVEDSPVIREFLVYILSSDPEIQVIGTATNGEEALTFLQQKWPDVITMDINMPKMNGLEATRRIMETAPVPIVIVSGSWNTAEVATTFRAMEAGAVAVLPRPQGIGHAEHEATAKELVQTVKLMSEVKVVKRWARAQEGRREKLPGDIIPSVFEVEVESDTTNIQVVALGASTGGPIVIQTILAGLSKNFPMPILIVQHIAPGFVQGFVEWLARTTGFSVRLAVHGEAMVPGHAYVAPDGVQMGVQKGDRIILNREEPQNGLCPSVAYLFRTILNVYGRNAVGVLLTGMGKDGAQELKQMKDVGAITIAQDQESSVVHGMPGEAIKLNGANYVLPSEKMASLLEKLVSKKRMAS